MKKYGRILIPMINNEEYKKFIKKEKLSTVKVIIIQLLIIILFITLWQVLSDMKLINNFLCSSPKKILETIISLWNNNDLLIHIWTTLREILISFIIGSLIGIIFAALLWWSPFISRVLDPYLTIINSLPKVSLGPLIIIWVGANVRSIIVMAILISVFTTIINMYNAFNHTDKSKILLLKSLNASKMQIFMKLVFPDNIKTLINTLKINISLSLIGVIMGELLVSKKGLGYLITYGSQVFNLNLVITSIFVLAIISYILYFIIEKIQRKLR